jgi:hypothetical protein
MTTPKQLTQKERERERETMKNKKVASGGVSNKWRDCATSEKVEEHVC